MGGLDGRRSFDIGLNKINGVCGGKLYDPRTDPPALGTEKATWFRRTVASTSIESPDRP